MDTIEIVGADTLADLRVLEGVAEAVFGRGDRRPGWFARKLAREGVDPRLSAIAVAPASGPAPEIVGYALLARSPSLGPVARGAGVGVAPAWRGQGLGRRLLASVRERARIAGAVSAIEFLAETERIAWYGSQGYAVVTEQLALLAHGLARPGSERAPSFVDAREAARESPSTLGAAPLWTWIPEYWARTPAPERAYVERAGARLWLTREGRAWLIHRCELREASSPVPALSELRASLPRTTPLVLYPVAARSASREARVDALVEAGFGPAQRSFVVRRDT